jgi:magnesium-transporting ATPase (P-type)
MEILDIEEKEIYSPKGKILGIIGGVCQIIGAISCLLSFYFHQLPTSSDLSDTTILINAGIQISSIGKLVFLPIGILCQRKAFFDFKFSPKWLWYIMLVCGLTVLFSSIMPINFFFLWLGAAILKHVLTEKNAYLAIK